ncbi:alpha/beta hydrolase [Hymenobacter sp. DH14]|uniref:Alpha/beta hydrolase n=1 Tax=Hymenobacter cyanobacteriorum TaxID=2926463 RepID=A0A9X2AGU7_9BACT|nr:alpha/beta hydrolase [Hymenobacter cyanobacteriorum]MCI1188048.1 alpha/beta hydrolase [Hymenobacter cyanobacteriorum]
MNKLISLLAILLSCSSALKAAPTAAPHLLGQWAGVLPVPGGSRQVAIFVSQQADGTPTAVLRIDAHRLDNSPMRVRNTADSISFVADQAGCRFVALPVAEGQRLRGTWQQPGFRTVLVLDHVAGASAAPVPAATFAIEEVHVSSPGSPNPEVGLGGILRRPAGGGPFAAVLLLPDAMPASAGSTESASSRLLDNLADYLLGQGLAVLRLDDRGLGRSAALPAATASAELAADAQSALNFLRSRPGIDPMRVGVLGHGEGGNVALLAATQSPAPAFVVAMAAAGVSGQELLARQTALVNRPGEPDTAQLAWQTRCAQRMAQARRDAKQQLAAGATPEQVQVRVAQEQLRLTTEARKRNDILYKQQFALLEIIRHTADNAQAQAIVANMFRQIYPGLAPATAQARAGQLTSPWYRSLLAFNPQAELAKVSCPTLLLHGAADAQVPAATNLAALEKGFKSNKQATSQQLDGVTHDFQPVLGERALLAGTTSATTTSEETLEAVGEWVAKRLK